MEDTIQFAVTACMLAHTITGDTSIATEQDIRQVMASDERDIIR